MIQAIDVIVVVCAAATIAIAVVMTNVVVIVAVGKVERALKLRELAGGRHQGGQGSGGNVRAATAVVRSGRRRKRA